MHDCFEFYQVDSDEMYDLFDEAVWDCTPFTAEELCKIAGVAPWEIEDPKRLDDLRGEIWERIAGDFHMGEERFRGDFSAVVAVSPRAVRIVNLEPI